MSVTFEPTVAAEADELVPVGRVATAIHLSERVHPHPFRGCRVLLMRMRNDIAFHQAADAFTRVVRTQAALRHRAETAANGEVVFRPMPEVDWPRLARTAILATTHEVERNPTPAEIMRIIENHRGLPGAAPIQAIWLDAADGGGFLVCALHETLADASARALLPRLIEAALLERMPPAPSPFAELMAAAAEGDLRPSDFPEPIAEDALHQDGVGEPRQRAEMLEVPLDESIWQRMKSLAARESLNPSIIAGTAFALLIERVAGGPVPLWRALQRRRSPSDFATIGNAMALCHFSVPVAAASSFLAAARATMNRYFEAIAFNCSDIPEHDAPSIYFEWEDDSGRLRALHPELSLGNAVLWSRCLPESAPSWDLKLTVRPPDGGTPGALQLTGDRARFQLPRLRSLLSAYASLLETIIVEPKAAPADMPLALKFDRALAWPASPNSAPSALDELPTDIAGLFAAIARRHADSPAIIWQGGQMSFAEVSAAVHDLAALLRRRGAEAGDIIAFRLTTDDVPSDRVLFLVAQIAAFQLGCALLPLGQQLPAAQARDQIARLGARFLIAAAPDIDCAPEWALDGSQDAPAPGFPGAILRALNNPAPRLTKGDNQTALLLTSSGTTGKPKTIRLSQAMLLRLFQSVCEADAVPPAPGLIGQNIGFDAILSDVWLPWIYGCHIVILGTERRTPTALAEARALGAKLLSLTPTSAAAALKDDKSCFDGFEMLVLMGEPLPLALARRLEQATPALKVLNAYGPTENGVWSTMWAAATAGERSIPIGRATPGYRVVIADPDLRPLPAHWPGEILIASAAPALGYHDAEMTASRFVELPGELPGPFFRSGDFGWIDETGRVEFIGRRDRQVKMNGVRIEIDGIEHCIAGVEGVADVGVLVEGPLPDHMRIFAAVEPKPGADPTELRTRILTHCRAWLPRAAIPSELVFIDAMPRSASGKKSHSALRAMLREMEMRAPGPDGTARTSPEPNSIEAQIASMWTELLQHNNVSGGEINIEDDVFAMGATSLDALRMAERIERRFGIRFPDHQIFIRRTIKDQSELVRNADARPGIPGGASSAPGEIEFHLVRAASGASRGIILGMPGIMGDIAHLGAFAASMLLDYDFWGCTCGLGGRAMTEETKWLDFSQAVAARLLADGMQPRAFIGFSWGGFLSWLIDRLLVAAGGGVTPIINLDGDPMHLQWAGAPELIKPHLPVDDAERPARKLLLYRGNIGGIIMPIPLEAEWARAGVRLEAVVCRTARHLDFFKPELFPTQSAAISAFIETGAVSPVLSAGSVDVDTFGGALFRLLEQNGPPAVAAVRELVEMLPPGQVDPDIVRTALVFLALAAGDHGFALGLANRLILEDPAYRDAVYAKVAILAQLDRNAEAEEIASAWLREHPSDATMAKRAGYKSSRRADLADAKYLFSGGTDNALDVAAGFCGPSPA